jgi:hypothetical protein
MRWNTAMTHLPSDSMRNPNGTCELSALGYFGFSAIGKIGKKRGNSWLQAGKFRIIRIFYVFIQSCVEQRHNQTGQTFAYFTINNS